MSEVSATDRKVDNIAAERLARLLYRAFKADDPTAFIGQFQPGLDGIPRELVDQDDQDDMELWQRTNIDGSFNLVAIARRLLADPRSDLGAVLARRESDP